MTLYKSKFNVSYSNVLHNIHKAHWPNKPIGKSKNLILMPHTGTIHISIIAITVVVYALVFFIVCIASFFLERFRALNCMDRFTWWAKGTKIFYFPIPFFTGLWYLLVDDTLKDDVVNGTTKTAFVAIYIHIGFNLLDSVLMAVGKLLYGNRFSTAYYSFHSSFCHPQSI